MTSSPGGATPYAALVDLDAARRRVPDPAAARDREPSRLFHRENDADGEVQAKSLDVNKPQDDDDWLGVAGVFADVEIDESGVALVEALDRLGASIFTAVPVSPFVADGEEFRRPSGWSTLAAAGNRMRLRALKPGWAICAVTGGVFAVVDVDPRHGGDVQRVYVVLCELSVRVFARLATPGGGAHFYVSGHPDLPLTHKLDGFPGVEVLSFGGNVFLPGTVRPKYDGRGYTVVYEDLGALGDGGDPDGAESLVGWVANRRCAPGDFVSSPPWDGTSPDRRQGAYLQKVLDSEAHALATTKPGGRNQALFTAAMKCGSYIAGAGMDESLVIERLTAAAHSNGSVQEDGMRQTSATLRSGLCAGREHPRAVPAAGSPAINGVDMPMTGVRSGVPGTPIRSEFPMLDLDKLLSAERSPREWVIEGLFPENASVSLVAPAGVGKSLLLLSCAIHLVDGSTTFAGLTIPRRRRVMYLDFENTEDDLAERFAALGVTAALADLVYIHLPPLRALNSASGGEQLRAVMAEYGISSGDVLIIDSTQRALDGDEDRADTINGFVRFTGLSLKRAGITVVRTDNTGQVVSRGARGSTAKRDDVDIEYLMSTTAAGKIILKVTKQRIPAVSDLLIGRTVDDAGQVIYSTADDPKRRSIENAIRDLDELSVPIGTGQRPSTEELNRAGRSYPRPVVRTAVAERNRRGHAPSPVGAGSGPAGR